MSYCRKCGAEIETGKNYCTYCGTDINDSSFNSTREENHRQQERRQNTTGGMNNRTAEFNEQDINNNKGIAAVAYIGIIGLIIALATSSNSKFVRFHANQSLLLLLSILICAFINIIPCLGTMVFFAWIVFVVVMRVIGFVSALTGSVQSIPLLGNIQLISL